MGWIGIDLDGTLTPALTSPMEVVDPIKPPIPAMLARVKALLADGKEVRIFTARVAACGETSIVACDDAQFAAHQRGLIEEWCREYLGQVLRVTATKDWQMEECWDDRVKQVITDKGVLVEDVLKEAYALLQEIQATIGGPV